MESKNLKNAEIARQSLENVKGGSSFVGIICPVCGGKDWEATTHSGPPGHTTLKCLSCGETYTYPTVDKGEEME